MASIGHVAVGMAAARAFGERRVAAQLGWGLLALAPDLDVIGFRLGVAYAAPFGHRGATHSIVFAVGCALVALALTRRPRVALLALVVVVSHPLLDALTDGGLGVALAWPFSTARVFAPVRPLPVAPIGARLLSGRGLHVLAVESLLFAPLVVYARARARAPA